VRAPRDLTVFFASKHPLQLLSVEVLQRPIEFTRGATVAVMHEPRLRLALVDSHPQRGEGQRLVVVLGHRPADDATRVQVEQHREVEPAFTRRQVRDVTGPHAVRRLGREVTVEEVGRRRQSRVRVRRPHELPTSPRTQLLLAHQSRDAMATDAPAASAKFAVNARTAVPLFELGEHGSDLDGEETVVLGSR
jgi:hypothetical protein